MAVIGEDFGPTISLDGARKVRGNLTQARIRWMVLAMLLGFGLVGWRLVQLGMVVEMLADDGRHHYHNSTCFRIVDGEPFAPEAYLPVVTGYYSDVAGNMLSFPFNSSSPILFYNKDSVGPYFIEAMEDSEIIFISYKDLNGLYEKNLNWGKFGRLLAETFFAYAQSRTEEFLFFSHENEIYTAG